MLPSAYRLALLFLGSGAIAWALGPVSQRYAAYLPLGGAAWWRSLVAAVLLSVLCSAAVRSALTKSSRSRQLLAALFYSATNWLWMTAFDFTLIARVQLIGCLAALVSLALNRVFRPKRFPGIVWAMTCTAILGVGMAVSFDPTQYHWGDLIALGAAISWGLCLFIMAPLDSDQKMATTVIAQWFTVVLVLAGAAALNGASGFPFPWPGWAQGKHLLAIGLTGAFAFWAFAKAQRTLPDHLLGLALPPEAVTAIALAWLLFGEKLGPIEVVGGLIAVTAVLAVSYLEAPKTK
jgi:drug/metabolite transporter (DMT)-like permease